MEEILEELENIKEIQEKIAGMTRLVDSKYYAMLLIQACNTEMALYNLYLEIKEDE